jgi:hypothetical protein
LRGSPTPRKPDPPNKGKDHENYGLSASNHTALHEKFSHKFQVLNLDRRYSSRTDG